MDWRPVKKLSAPEGYNWDDEEVLYEKNDSWITGFIIGWITSGVTIGLIISLVAR